MAGVTINFPIPPSVPSFAQWVSYFKQCQPVLGFVPLDAAGGTVTGTLFIAPGVAIQLSSITVSELPSPGPSNVGQVYLVSDAASPVWNQPLTGGGATTCMAVSNGLAWTAH